MDNVIIRPGLSSDHDAAMAVWLAANTERRGGRPPKPEHEARSRGYIRKPDAFLVVAEDAGAIVGMALGMQGRADGGAGPPIPGYCHISMVFVAPGRWGEGIGGRTVDTIMAEARSRGFDHTKLWTHADNARAQRLYEGRGFRRTGREVFDDSGDLIVEYERGLTEAGAKEEL